MHHPIQHALKRLYWPVLKGWRRLRGQTSGFDPYNFQDTSDTQKFTVAPKGMDAPPTKVEQTIFRDDQPRFRALSASRKEDVKKILESGQGFRVRIARRAGIPRPASELVEKRYGSRGYTAAGKWDDPHLFTFMEYQDGALVGTVGIRFDSSNGLGAEKAYAEELAALREQGYKLCEFTQLAIENTADSITALGTLFHSAYLWAGVVHDFNYCVIEVVTRHVSFYQRILGFSILGAPTYSDIAKCEATLLGIPFEDIAAYLRKRNSEHSKSTSAFNYGFSEEESAAIVYELERVKIERQAQQNNQKAAS